MEGVINNGICRCCASEGTFKDVKTKYQWMGEEEIYSDMLKDCFDITLSTTANSDEGGICEVCITQLRNAHNFKKQVLHTEEQFRKRLQEQLFQSKVVKIEVSKEADDDESDTNLSDDYALTEYKVDVKQESREESPKPRKRVAKPPAKPTTSKAKKVKVEDGESSKKNLLRTDKVVIKIEPLHKIKKTPVNQKIPVVTLRKEKVIRISHSTISGNSKRIILRKATDMDINLVTVKTLMQCSNATPLKGCSGIGFTCSFCSQICTEAADLKQHTIQLHSKSNLDTLKNRSLENVIKLDITDLQCKLCESEFETLDQLTQHLKTVHNQTIQNEVKNFIIPFKFQDDNHKCALCPHVASNFKMLLEHMNSHYRNYICKVCDTGFVTRRNLHSHTSRHATGVYNCPHCQREFDNPRKMKDHEKIVHLGINKRSKCWYCGERFTSNVTKSAHEARVHGAKSTTVKCQACDKEFANGKKLSKHTKIYHLMEKRHKCEECEKRFFTTKELKEHMVKHTGIREFKCELCQKSYGRKRTLREHMRIHANDRRFKCEHCGQAFVQKCSWKGHMRSKHKEQI